MNNYKLLINGQWIEGSSDTREDVIDPANESVIGYFNHATPADIDAAGFALGVTAAPPQYRRSAAMLDAGEDFILPVYMAV